MADGRVKGRLGLGFRLGLVTGTMKLWLVQLVHYLVTPVLSNYFLRVFNID